MERRALLVYLKNVLALEIAKHKLDRIYQREQQNFQTKKDRLMATDLWPETEKASLAPIAICCVVFTIIEGIIDWAMKWYLYDSLWSILGALLEFAAGVIMVGSIVLLIIGAVDNHRIGKEQQEIRLHNLEEEKRIRKNRELLDEIERKWNKRESYLRSEYQKVRVLLQDAYKMNILATQYRNLASVLYIYDYMASSQASFTDTLIHEHMENGIQRIEAKLDSIVMQNEQIILHNRHQEALNSQMTEKTDNMIRTLQQTERNTMLAAQYAELSAVYSRANAYFGYANYLK